MISVKRNGHVVVATLARLPVNALNGEIVARLEAVVDEVTADKEIAMLRVRSDQKVFCAGADLALMHRCFSTLEGPDAMLAFVRRMQLFFQRIEMAPFLTLAEIGGAAVGGGMELALSCDLRIAANEANLGLPEAQLGLLPGAGGTQRLARLCGIGVAKRLILGGQVVDGSEAARLEMVQWACPREELADKAHALAIHYAAIPRVTLAANKRCLAAISDPARDGFAEELTGTRDLYDYPETRRRVSEFLNRKKV